MGEGSALKKNPALKNVGYRSVLLLLEVLRHPHWELWVNSASETIQVECGDNLSLLNVVLLHVVSVVTFQQGSASPGWLQLTSTWPYLVIQGFYPQSFPLGPSNSAKALLLILQQGISGNALTHLSQNIWREKKLGESLIEENVSPAREVKLSVNKTQHHKALHTQIVNLLLSQLVKSLILYSVTFDLFSSYRRMFQTQQELNF